MTTANPEVQAYQAKIEAFAGELQAFRAALSEEKRGWLDAMVAAIEPPAAEEDGVHGYVVGARFVPCPMPNPNLGRPYGLPASYFVSHYNGGYPLGGSRPMV